VIVWLIALGIVLAGVAVVVATQLNESRIDKQVTDTADWQETEATIQDAVIERLSKYIDYPSFAFSYSVRGEYFSGRFFLKADYQQGQELIKSLLGRRFPVQYDPDNLSAWYIADETMEGCEIIQKLSAEYPSEYDPYRSDGDEPIDLHLGS
jgi:hypothetical protein